MKWSWRVGSVSGIALYLHATFLLLLAWVAVGEYQRSRSVSAAAAGVAFVVAVFLTVVLHEFGHAFAARRYGIKTRDITLLPIGGVARLERMPREPRQEM
ncbi:MAG TPA: site-2 protease family protein, partial [Gemmatimonadaceae bacterium]|nr:site-2 protease family protein [Gemmatimonadaceae bacterium]